MSEFYKYKTMDVSALIAYENNARTHSEEQVMEIVRSIKTFGFTNPVLVDEKDVIIAGHGRLMAAQALGMHEVPCIEVTGLDDEKKRALILADNRIAMSAGWNSELLAQELAALSPDLQRIAGFTEDELADLLNPDQEEEKDPDAIPDMEISGKVKDGDIWQLGAHRLMCGDSLDIEQVELLTNRATVNCVITDPPYAAKMESKAGKVHNDDLEGAEFAEFLFTAFSNMMAVMAPGAPIYVCYSEAGGPTVFQEAFIGAGFKFSSNLIWVKDALVLGRLDYQPRHETVIYGWRPGSKHKWYGGRRKTSVKSLGENNPFTLNEDGTYTIRVGDQIMIVEGDAKVKSMAGDVIHLAKQRNSPLHPTMKPVELMEQFLACSARPGDLVLDLFGGSGTTLIACERMGQSACLMEMDPVYVERIIGRWEEYTGRTAERIRDGGDVSDEQGVDAA